MLNVIKKNVRKPRRMLIYGTAGIGKTTLASKFPKPIFMLAEDGLGALEVDHFPLLESTKELESQFQALLTEKHEYETLVLDSVDWLDKIIGKKVASDNGVKTVGEIPYGRGYEQVAGVWSYILGRMNDLRDKGMAIVLIGHAQVKRFEDPTTQGFDRYVPRLHEKSSNLVTEWCDEVLFARYRVATKTEKGGFGKERRIGVGDGERVLHPQERPGWVAKNRLGMPEEIDMSVEAIFSYMKG